MTATIRERVADDDPFIFGGWLKSFRNSEDTGAGPYPPDLYFKAARETIERLFARPGVDVLVLEADVIDEEAVARPALLGFIAHERAWRRWSRRRRELEQWHVVHYVYVRDDARGQGAARLLLNAAEVRRDSPATAYTFHTRAARRLLGAASRFLPDASRYPSKETP